MEKATRTEAFAAKLRSVRVPAVCIALVVTVILGSWSAAAGIGSLLLWAMIAVFCWFPGIETFVRNFRVGYNDPR